MRAATRWIWTSKTAWLFRSSQWQFPFWQPFKDENPFSFASYLCLFKEQSRLNTDGFHEGISSSHSFIQFSLRHEGIENSQKSDFDGFSYFNSSTSLWGAVRMLWHPAIITHTGRNVSLMCMFVVFFGHFLLHKSKENKNKEKTGLTLTYTNTSCRSTLFTVTRCPYCTNFFTF